MRSLFLSFLLSLLSVLSSTSFLYPLTLSRADFSNGGHRFIEKQQFSLHLRPIGTLEEGHGQNLHAFASLTTNSPIPPIGNVDFSDISVVEEGDLPELSRHVLSVFGVNFVRWMMGGSSSLGVGTQQPPWTSTNSMAAAAYAEILLGFQYRLGKRLTKMNLSSPLHLSATAQESPIARDVERDSLVLVISRNLSSRGQSAEVGGADSTEIVASVELSLEPKEIFRPSNSNVSNALSNNGTTEYVPYVRNLCVNKDFQRRNFGTTLMNCVEHITKNIWGFDKVSLHVFDDNVVANAFYLKTGYQVVSKEGGIGYYEKPFR